MKIAAIAEIDSRLGVDMGVRKKGTEEGRKEKKERNNSIKKLGKRYQKIFHLCQDTAVS